MPEGAADRTERATPKRRAEARKHGQVVLSPEVSPVVVLLAALALSTFGAPTLLARSRLILADWLAAVGPVGAGADGIGAVVPLLARSASQMATLLVPFFVAVAVVGGIAVLVQVG